MAEMPIALYRAPVSPGALVVLSRLWAHASAGRLFVFPKVETLREDLGVAHGTIYSRLAELREAGLVVRERQRPPGGARRVAGWTLVENLRSGGGPEARTVQEPGQSGSPESKPPDPRNPLSIGISHMKLPHSPLPPSPDFVTSGEVDASAGCFDAEVPGPDELARIDAEAAARYAPSAPAGSGGGGAQARRLARAAALWDRYEDARVARLDGRRRRAAPASKARRKAHASIVRLVAHVREVEDVDPETAWARVEAYALGSIDEAAQARGEFGDRMRKWRSDWSEWRTTRFDQWAAGASSGAGGGWRGPIDPATQDHDEDRLF